LKNIPKIEAFFGNKTSNIFDPENTDAVMTKPEMDDDSAERTEKVDKAPLKIKS
jgi:hypothetical protein